MTTTTRYSASDHALANCKGQLENIIDLYKRFNFDETDDQAREEVEELARDEALDVCWKSDEWQAVGAYDGHLFPTKGRVLLSWGGPACQVVCDLDGDVASNPEIQWQDWGTPWTTPSIKCELELDFDTANDALEWFINLFCWGE